MSQTIDTIIDKKAYEQVELLRDDVQGLYMDVLKTIDLGKSGFKMEAKNIKLPSDLKDYMSDLNKYAQKQEKQIESLQNKVLKLKEVRNNYHNAVIKAIENERKSQLALDKNREKAFDNYEKQLEREKKARENQVKKESQLRQTLARQKEQEYKQEVRNAEKAAKNDERQNHNQKILARNAREYAVISSKLSTEYEKQSTILVRLSRRYQDLSMRKKQGIALTEKEEKEFRDLGQQIKKLDKNLKDVDAEVGKHQRNVGNYASAWGNVGGVIRSAAAAFGIYSALDIGRQIIDQIKEIDGLDKALLKITETQEDFNDTLAFLGDLADRSGIKINTLESTYTKFFASAKNTNLTLKQIREIFDSVAMAGASLNLSTEDITGAFRALEQMLSKGKVQAEEIRGQLGERLPGAFQILAESMGKSTSELDKMLEKGEVIADEVLPNFAKQLQKTFSLDNAQKIETLNAAQGRLSNSWNAFVRTLSESEGTITKILMGVYKGMAYVADGLRLINDAQNMKETSVYNQALQTQLNLYKDLGDEAQERAEIDVKSATSNINTIESQIKAIEDKNAALKEDSRWMLKHAAEVYRNGTAIDDLNVSLARETARRNAASRQLIDHTEWLAKNTDEKKKNNDQDKDPKKIKDYSAEDFYNLQKARLERAIEVNKEITENEQKELSKRLAANNALTENKQELAVLERDWAIANAKDRKDKILETEEAYNSQSEENTKQHIETEKEILSSNFEYQVNQFKKTAEAKELALQQEINAATKKMIEEGATREQIEARIQQIRKDSYRQQLEDLIAQAEKELLVVATNAEEKAEVEKWLANLRKELNDLNMPEKSGDDDKTGNTLFSDEEIEGLQKVQELIVSISDLFAAFSARRIAQIEAEIEANNRLYEKVQNDEHATEQQKEESRKFREEREKELRKKLAKEKEKQAKIDKAAAVAEIAINTAIAISRVTADAGIFGIPLIPIIAALGALQIATVLAQPIPKFKEGHLSGTYEGWAMINDSPSANYREILEQADGTLYSPEERNQKVYMKRGDKVHKSHDSFLETKGYKEIMDATIMASLVSGNLMTTEKEVDEAFNRRLLETIDKGIKKGFSGAEKPANTQQKDFDYNRFLNEMKKHNFFNV